VAAAVSSAVLILGSCATEKPEPVVQTESRPSGPPRHWDIGDQVNRHQLPEDISDGYLQFGRSGAMSYGLTLAHERISARSHSRSDMLIYVHGGVGRFHIDDKEFTGATGDLVFIPKGAVYSIDSMSKRQLELMTLYAPPLDTADVVYHEAAERVQPPPGLNRNIIPIDTIREVDSLEQEKMFEQMEGSTIIEDEK
jgi:mannose-6-phosphate isomerase-like protein (cupin superfamily)